jgi:glutamine phosphoribosylpyrophosphate amidotransferase
VNKIRVGYRSLATTEGKAFGDTRYSDTNCLTISSCQKSYVSFAEGQVLINHNRVLLLTNPTVACFLKPGSWDR